VLITQTDNKHLQARGPKVGLALAGGGPLGVIYEMGALLALEESLEGVDFHHLHAYVGVSAGAVVASVLANHITAEQMVRIVVMNDFPEHALDPAIFLTPAFKEYYHRLSLIPSLLWRSIFRFIKNPFDIGLMESFASLGHAIPTGIFDNEPIHEFIGSIFNSDGRTNDFRKLDNHLYIIAVDLDTGNAVKLGSEGYDDVPISKAVQASAALPGLYPPVEIKGRYFADGALKKTLHASVALEAGSDLVICVNPLVPYDANLALQTGNARHDTLIEGGAPVVLSQTFRSMIYSRMKVGMGKYDTQFENSDIILFEPNRDDSNMFFANVFSFSSRRLVCEHAYQTTRTDLLGRREQLEPILARHGISLRMDLLQDQTRNFTTPLYEDQKASEKLPYKDAISGSLTDTLDQLQDWIHTVR
jgi:predicted acylesterase/phospholipase RssA